MKATTILLLTNLFILSCFNSLMGQSTTPLSFDSKIPFSNIKAYAIRGNSYFYEQLYSNIKNNYDKEILLTFDYNQNGPTSIFSKPKYVELTPTAGDFSMIGKFSVQDSNFVFMANYNRRAYNYFQTQDVNGSLASDMISVGLGAYAEGTSLMVFFTTRSDSHSYSKKAKTLPVDLKGIYDQRYTEINNRLKKSDFKEFERDAVALAGYSKEMNAGFVVAVSKWNLDYVKLDADYAYLAMAGTGFTYTQAALNLTTTVRRLLKQDFASFLKYEVLGNFADRFFAKSKNVISDAEVNMTRFIRNEEDSKRFPVKVSIQFDHRNNRIASAGGSIRLSSKAFFIGYGYNYINPKVFQPTKDRLYSQQHLFFMGIEK